MSLFEEWREYASTYSPDHPQYNIFWTQYFHYEKGIYEELLEETEPVTGTVQELADKYQVDLRTMTGFIDGINDSLVTGVTMETLKEDAFVSLEYDKERLFYNMVAARADWLYELPQWERLLTRERRKELYREQKTSTTVVKGPKIGRNDPCPCGSGKKYKQCCGK